jgi:hypothetical protein
VPDGGSTVRTSDSSIYLSDHKLYPNQRIYVTPDTTTNPSATLPSTTAGAPEPSDANTINAVYNAVISGCDSIVSTMGNDAGNYYIWYPTNYAPTYALWWEGSITTTGNNGDSEYQYGLYGDWGFNNALYFRLYNGSSGTSYYSWGGTNNEGASIIYTGNPVDVGAYYNRYSGTSGDTNLGGKGMYWQSTPYEYGQYTPYIIQVKQFPNPATMGDSSFDSNYYYDYSYYSKRTYSQYTTATTSDQNTRIDAGDGWRYTYGSVYHQPSNFYKGAVSIYINLENTNWSGYAGSDGLWGHAYYGSQTFWSSNTYARGSYYRIEVLIPINDDANPSNYGPSGSTLNIAQMASTIVSNVISQVSYPEFSNPVGLNTVYAGIVNSNRIQLRNQYGIQYLFSNQGTGPLDLETDQTSGIIDDYYNVIGVTSTTVSIGSSNQISPRILEFDSVSGIQTYNGTPYLYIAGGHGLSNGQKVVFNVVSGSAPTGITNGNTYYAIVADNEYLSLAASTSDWQSNNSSLTDPAAPGSLSEYNLTINSISGRVAAAGTIGISTSTTKIVDGFGTKFISNYKEGDRFIIKGSGTPATYIDTEISSVISDTQLRLSSPAGIATGNAQHFVDTKINVRADGTFIHRPFDGGVEITAGKSPDSTIVRQTRKYFRYQSGKGIQCSVAINFNPSRPIQLASGSGTSITMTTEYPHGLSVGNRIRVDGAEEHISYTPSTASYNATTGEMTITINSHGFQVGEYVTLAENSFTFTCDKDSNATNHSYPRSTDPAGSNTRLEIRSVTTNTFVVNVGTSTYAGTHSFVSVASDAVTHINTSNGYNGTYEVTGSTDFTFSYTGGASVNVANPKGFIQYAIQGYKNAGVRCGLFDFQNGFFYEYDGKYINAVRRSSVQQLSGTAVATKNSNLVSGSGTRFQDQLQVGDYIVIRGQSYKVVHIVSNTELNIQPKYRGTSQSGVVMTKTVDTKVPQYDWNIDVCDGTGPSGFTLDINNIQMAYFDYSWYGAGKIRFGFKDTNGRVRYVHEFVHNNILNEAYMRSGNIPARYEVYNKGIPTFVPSLFHWGTSVIMDGRFDDDDSYLFTASGNSLTFTNGSSASATTTDAGFIYRQRIYGSYSNYYLAIPFSSADSSKFSAGIPLYTSDGELNGETVSFTGYSGSTFYVYIYLSSGYSQPGIYPNISNGTSVSIGAPASGGVATDLNSLIPLISVRLSPSVDNGLIGVIGQRDIINRMQLKMKELGVSVSHDSLVTVVLNGRLSNVEYGNVGSPSLSQYVAHSAGDTISGGTVIYSFRASGGTEGASGKRFSNSSNFDLSGLTDLGNSILGGDSVFPNGPDILTICATPVDSSEIDQTSAYQVSSRVSWSESQA